MRKFLILAVAFLLAGFMAVTVNAGSNGTAVDQTRYGVNQDATNGAKKLSIKKKKAETSLDAQYKKRIKNKKRAEELRKKKIKEGRSQTVK